MNGEEIVVTGISGVFPKSDSVQEFMENLYNKVDMVSQDLNFDKTDPGLPRHSGKIDKLEKFDAQFFKVAHQQAIVMEPLAKKILEHAYGAIFDSGNTHVSLKSKKVGVFIGSYFTDFSIFNINNTKKNSGLILTGCTKSMIANRVSYWMDAKGPSYCLDNTCVSSTAALEHAYNSIKNGSCDAAVVGGCNNCVAPLLSWNLKNAGLLCLDGKTKCFDKNGDGYVRSDAISVIFLQKSKDAKRVYAEVCYAEGSYHLKDNDQFLPIPKVNELQKFLENVYSKCDIDPKNVEYVEANAAALSEADENEVEAIANIFIGSKVIKLGSVKSNMGNSEAASGLCSLTKLCLAYHKGEIPANLHLQDPIKPVKDGKVQVVTENTKFERGYTAFNDISFTGSRFHVILKGHYKKKNLENYKCGIPRLVIASGRQELCVFKIFDALKSKQIDEEEIALLHNIFQNDIAGHTSRGHIILDTINESTVSLSQNIDYYSGIKTPLWFVFSGMGSQWAGMGADLLRIPTFAAAIERCQKALQPYEIDLLKVITDLDKKIFGDSVHVFVGIGAVQIGLIDILKELGVVPDYIIGHSLGELACAYYDDALTAEQTILCIYSRSKSVSDLTLIKGSMAAVGMGYKNLMPLCPSKIDIACHNSSKSSTISGPADDVEKFVGELKKRKIFTKIVQTGNVAYHSRYIAEAGAIYLKLLSEIITNPKPRSNKWISSSVPKEEWNDPAAKYSSAEYHANNFLKPVLFEEVLRLIPEKAVVVEIAPHGLMQAILTRSHEFCTHIPLTNKGSRDNLIFLLQAIGKLYKVGLNPKIDILYPKVSFPVSTETPFLSHLVAWEHSENWPTKIDEEKKQITYASRNMAFSLQDEDYKYLKDYIRNGVNVLPEAALLAFVWETLAMYKKVDFRNMSVVFKNIQFHSEIIINAEVPVRLKIEISKGNSTFEVTQDKKLIVSGTVLGQTHTLSFRKKASDGKTDMKLASQDIYKIFQIRGFNYRGKFQSIVSTTLDRTKALIKWTKHWITFLDSLIQLNIISRDYNGISKPKYIEVMKINTQEQKMEMYETINDYTLYDAELNNDFGITTCAGVMIEGLTYIDIPRNEKTADVIETKTFFPFHPANELNMITALKMSFQIITENTDTKNLLITKVVDDDISKDFDCLDEIVEKFIFFNYKINELKFVIENFITTIEYSENKTNIILMENVLLNAKIIMCLQNISKNIYILTLENEFTKMLPLKDCFDILNCIPVGKKTLGLMRRHTNYNILCPNYISYKFDDTFSWIADVYNKLSTSKRVVFISENQPYCGVLGFFKKLKMTGHYNISVVIVDDINAPKFDPDNQFYKKQLQKNMTINIMRNGQWGSFYFKTSKLLSSNQTNFVLKSSFTGNTQKQSWIEAPIISGDKTLAQVCYSGLSMENCHNIIQDTNRKVSGMDFSGIDSKGDKIMGLIAGNSVSTTVEVDSDLVWPVPNHWTLEDAATVPLAYAQAYYCLTIRKKIRTGKSILICDATSYLSLALISLCLSLEYTIFTVVNNENKKKMLLGLYPQLDELKIICSCTDGFYFTLMSLTMGQGCDYVITYATSTFREAAAKCVGSLGDFFYIREYDNNSDNMHFDMSLLDFDKSFTIIHLSNIFKPETFHEKKILQKHIAEGIESGVVKPLSRVVFSPDKIDKAIRVLALNEHAGKVLIRIKDPSIMRNGLETIPRISYSTEDVLVIVGDEGGVALELADKLIERGAKQIVLHMTSYKSGYIQSKFLAWSKQKVLVQESSDNIENKNGCVILMNTAKKFGRVKGLFIVFDPKHTDDGTRDDFINAFKKQSKVVMNLDMVTRNVPDLRHFVVISRFTKCVSEEYAQSITENICDNRNKMGFPALVLQYESILELNKTESEMNRTSPQTLSALFNAIETSLKLNYTKVLTFDLKKIKDQITSNDFLNSENNMYTFYKHLHTEMEKVTSQTVIEMPTLASTGTLNANWDLNEPFIILVPGFDGRTPIFEPVTERLKIRAVALQFELEMQEKCFNQIALTAKKELTKTMNDREGKKFSIMGYSFGVNIALELAALYEREGRTGVVFCVDSSPDALRILIEDVLGKLTKDQLQNHVLNHMCNLITGKNGKELESDLHIFDTFEAKVEECLKRMKGEAFSYEYKKSVLKSAYNRIVMARKYRPRLKLRSQLVLMKSSKHIIADKLAVEYNLSKYSYVPVKVYPLLADNPATVLSDCRISNIVNSFVDAEDLEMFKKKNLCEMYYN